MEQSERDSNERIEKRLRQEIMDLCGSRFCEASMADIKFPKEIHLKLLKWVKEGKNMLLFTGNPGTGKTHLCMALYRYCYTKFPSKRYWLERKFLARARESIESKGDYIDNMQHYCDDYLVILDDFGSCGFTDWRKEVWQAFLDYRYQNELPTIITTNLSREEIDKQFHPRFSSRLFAKENLVIEVDGEDFRQVVEETPGKP